MRSCPCEVRNIHVGPLKYEIFAHAILPTRSCPCKVRNIQDIRPLEVRDIRPSNLVHAKPKTFSCPMLSIRSARHLSTEAPTPKRSVFDPQTKPPTLGKEYSTIYPRNAKYLSTEAPISKEPIFDPRRPRQPRRPTNTRKEIFNHRSARPRY
ncbi:hypothetical protein BKA93DRAFT_770327 [Sparassis latifolia]